MLRGAAGPLGPRAILAAALVAGAALRLAAAAAYWSAPLTPGGDDRQYHALASALARGEGFALRGEPSAYRAPLYPLFLAAGSLLSPEPGFLRLLQALLGILTVWLVYRVVTELHSEAAGGWGALAAALHPEQVLLPTSLYLECFYAAAALAALWAALRWSRAPSDGRAAVLGAALGATLLTRSFLAVWPALLLAQALRAGRKPAETLRHALIAGAAAAMLLAPWIARNALRFGRFIPFETGVAGPVLWYASEGFAMIPERQAGREPMRSMYRDLPHTEWDRYAGRLAARNIARRPPAYAWGCLRRVFYMWTDSYTPYLLHGHPALSAWLEGGSRWDLIRWGDRLLRLALLALAGVALRRRPESVPLRLGAGLVLYFNLYALGAVFPRFLAPLTPVLCALAGCGAAELLKPDR